MTTSSWPTGVPTDTETQPYRRDSEDNRAAFRPELGPPKYRRRHTANSTLHAMSIPMSLTDLQALHTFYDDTLLDGTLPFLFTDPVLADEATFTFETPIQDVPMLGFDPTTGERWWKAVFTMRRMP